MRTHHKEEGVRQVIDGLVDNERYLVADKKNPSNLIRVQEHHLVDSAYWVSYEFTLEFFANAKKVVGGSRHLVKAGETATIEHFSKSALFLSRIFSTKFVCKQATKLNARFNRTKEVKLAELTSRSARFELHYYPNFKVAKDICNWNLGIYTGIIKTTGATDVKGEEIKCVVDGDENCVFRMTWNKKPNFFKRISRWILRIISAELVADYEAMVKDRDQLIGNLSQSEARYRALVENAKDIIVLIQEGSIKFVNKYIEEFSDYKVHELIGKPFIDFIHNEDKDEALQFYTQRMNNKNVPESYPRAFVNKNGDKIDTEINVASIQYNDKPALLAIIRDQREKNRAEEEKKNLEAQLRQAHKMEAIGTLAGGIAHDINNILGIILGNTELAMDDVPEWNPARVNLEEVKTASLRAKDVVRQLLSFARKTEQQRKPVNISPIITDALRLLRSSIPTTIEIRSNIPIKSETILADPTQVNQVLINLCANATHAMEKEGGILDISLESVILEKSTAQLYELAPGRFVKLTISDTGHGIDNDIKDRIFDPYFTTRDVGKGSGMGLAVVHGIVSNHDGAIFVDSKLGKGAVFTVFLPIIEKRPALETTADDDLPTGNESILLVDDEESIVKMGRKRLERLGYKVESTTSPLQALDLFRSRSDQFDLVITDLTMPQKTGDKLLKEILNIRPDTPIILCTGFSEKMNKEKAKEIGAAGYLEKPHEKLVLAKMVRRVLDAK